jgi:hypothetical protein
MKLSAPLLVLGLLQQTLCGQIPHAVIPAGVGVNIHFVTGHARDLDLITNAGFQFVRMDFSWEATEGKAGAYDWTEYDELTAHLEQRGLRALYILDYVNGLYEPMVDARRAVGEPAPEKHVASPRHPESVAAFARWAAAAAVHFRGRHVLWEIYNEPNGGFWRPKPDAAEYTTLALATARAIREAEPSATIIAPAMSGFDWKYMESFLQSGVLEFLDGVSVHPYRDPNRPPETAATDYKKLRELIDRYAPESKRGKIPILSGEWGYASNTKGVSLETQAAYAVRQQLGNLLNGVPLSIWYDWKNDGHDPADNEQNFGTVKEDLEPKPAYTAVKTMTAELSGYRLERRLDGSAESDFVLLFVNEAGAHKAVGWTLTDPHVVHLTGLQPEVSLELGPLPRYVAMAFGTPSGAQVTSGLLLNSFETSADLLRFTRNNCAVSSSTEGVTDGQKAALVVFSNLDWPNLHFKVGTGFANGDWRGWGAVAVDILNNNPASVTVDIRVDDDLSADGAKHCQTGSIGVPAGQKATVVMPLSRSVPPGMKGGPPIAPDSLQMNVSGPSIDLSHIVAFQIFLPKPARQTALFLDNIRLLPPTPLGGLADQYGQFTRADWPGKIHQDADFRKQDTEERQWLAANPKPPDRDLYGAWRDGPLLTNNSFFRTAFVLDGQEVSPGSTPANQGRWWLVAPSGRLFFSLGVDVIGYEETTRVAGRESLFDWLPGPGDPLQQFSYPGPSRTANFYGMDLYRKYGTNWRSQARSRALDRLDSWGFNTIGNWSSSDLFETHRVAYTVSVGYDNSGLAKFFSASQQMTDVFDARFPARMAAGISNAVAPWKDDPWCLGYFVENELPWAGWGSGSTEQYALPIGVLASTNALPAKAEFARLLQSRYSSVSGLNAAWNTRLASWNDISIHAVTLPSPLTAACVADLGGFLTDFSSRYFSIVRTNMKQFAPNQLYLGCRFASRPTEAVSVAAQYCDVVSFNIYNRSLDPNTWGFTSTLGKPCVIGEFHFGALDRGMFHPGLVRTGDQADRGRAYQEYLQSVLTLPAFVGCHWFQYCDEPLTGRFDGENYNIGMVSGTDTPYGELVAAARQIQSEIYSRKH